MKSFVICVLCIGLSLNPLFSQSLKSVEDVNKLATDVMNKLVARQFNLGIDLFKPYTILKESDLNVIKTQIESKLQTIESNYGICVGYELVFNEQIGESLLKIIELQKYDKYALRWNMVFYNNGEEWKLVNISYNDNIIDLFSK